MLICVELLALYSDFGPSSSMIERTSASELIDKCKGGVGHRYSTWAVALVSHIPGFYCNSVVTGMLRWEDATEIFLPDVPESAFTSGSSS